MDEDIHIHPDEGRQHFNSQSIEERNFNGALLMIISHFTRSPPIGRKTINKALETVRRTMDKTLNKSEIREVLAKNVDIWLRLQTVFLHAISSIGARSMRETYPDDPSTHLDIPDSSALIAENYASLLEDLTLLNNLLVIGRNMLAIKEIAQEICCAAQLGNQIIKLVVLCVNVTSKGYDGENVDNLTRARLNEITELYKKLLITCLQFLHNLTMGNDVLKMAFWFEMLFDNDLQNDPNDELPPDGFRVDVAYQEVRNWLIRNMKKSPIVQEILDEHQDNVEFGHTAGPLPPDLYQDQVIDEAIMDHIERRKVEFPERLELHNAETHETLNIETNTPFTPIWNDDASSKRIQDLQYGRVSHEIDVWWKRVRDANYEQWVVPMENVEEAIRRAEACKDNAMTRYIPRVEHEVRSEPHPQDRIQEFQDEAELGKPLTQQTGDDDDNHSLTADYGEDDIEEEEEEEDGEEESYVEGPLRGLLTEIPNILDTKQIEALHMTVKACIVDAMGSGLTRSGENLQKTRCKMFLALDCGKNLLREMLVFIAVWEQAETQFIFQITAQIIESFHHNALLPYAWNSLRIVKDIVSPAQTVLLRLINYMYRARKGTAIYNDVKDYNRDAKLVHFLYNYFRCRVVPDCLALMYAQAQIRARQCHPSDFPVDLWDMERAKDGLSQYLDFISVVADIPQMRPLLIEWEAVYELVALLNALEASVVRKPLVEPLRRTPTSGQTPASAGTDATVSPDESHSPYPDSGVNQTVEENGYTTQGLPALHDTPHKFPWAGIKVQIMIIFASLVQPPNDRSGPGNPVVQKQILDHNGVLALLNCCVYDGHNEYLKERATLALKWVMDGCGEAQDFVRNLSPLKPQPAPKEVRAGPQASAHGESAAVLSNVSPAEAAEHKDSNVPKDEDALVAQSVENLVLTSSNA